MGRDDTTGFLASHRISQLQQQAQCNSHAHSRVLRNGCCMSNGVLGVLGLLSACEVCSALTAAVSHEHMQKASTMPGRILMAMSSMAVYGYRWHIDIRVCTSPSPYRAECALTLLDACCTQQGCLTAHCLVCGCQVAVQRPSCAYKGAPIQSKCFS